MYRDGRLLAAAAVVGEADAAVAAATAVAAIAATGFTHCGLSAAGVEACWATVVVHGCWRHWHLLCKQGVVLASRSAVRNSLDSSGFCF
jgi:hypothetical protein